MRNILFFSRKELLIIFAVGLGSGLVDHQVLSALFASVARLNNVMMFDFWLANATGGPLFGDFLQTWLEFGAVLAACLVRKPAAGTIALTINGFCQVFFYGTHDPHLFYGFSGLGADVVFAWFRYSRYDFPTVCLAGISCGVFWYPIVWFTHGIYLYPVSFIVSDFAVRVVGSAIGDGLIGAALALAFYTLIRRRWDEPIEASLGGPMAPNGRLGIVGLLVIGLGVVLIVLTYALPPVSSFFLSIGPSLPPGVPSTEEYNPGYVLGLLLIFLSLVVMAFRNLESRRLR